VAAAITTEHESWCVRPRHTGVCSEKRGHWDRSTNTWVSELTDDDRRMILRALVRYRREGESRESVISWVQTHPGFEHTTVDTLQTWYMTYRKYRNRGKRWPI
jgi:proteasome lid subunit RPN8/RPN11